MAMWAAHVLAARIAFSAQTIKLAPVMLKLRKTLLVNTLPVLMFMMGVGFAPLAMADAMPGTGVRGAAALERSPRAVAFRDEISLDEAVARAEQQYRARVVRTEVQDEDGRKVYVLKLLSDNGRVITVRIDAATGRMR